MVYDNLNKTGYHNGLLLKFLPICHLSYFSGVCLFGDQSDGCIFECHCKTKSSCDTQTGSCDDDGCADSDARDTNLQAAYKRRGSGCQIGE